MKKLLITVAMLVITNAANAWVFPVEVPDAGRGERLPRITRRIDIYNQDSPPWNPADPPGVPEPATIGLLIVGTLLIRKK